MDNGVVIPQGGRVVFLLKASSSVCANEISSSAAKYPSPHYCENFVELAGPIYRLINSLRSYLYDSQKGKTVLQLGIEILSDGPEGSRECSETEAFQCDEQLQACIDKSLVCDGVSQCRNGYDESVAICGCLPTEFQCNNSHCISLIKRCDHNWDCKDGNDELDCETFECPSTHVKCDNHFCIPRDKECNFIDDCGDNSDESTCKRRDCHSTEFRCNNSQCIPTTYLCDGQRDCTDGTDEEAQTCNIHFKCPSGLYIHRKVVCDGWVDCRHTHLDETDCGLCTDSQFACHNNQCIEFANVCDNVCDCVTCEDEINCGPVTKCEPGKHYHCREHDRCIKSQYLCDNTNNCLNTKSGADEYFCWNISNGCRDFRNNGRTSEEYIVCPEGRCLPASLRCDHINDCLNGEDELNCDFPPCEAGEYRCDNHQCIPHVQRCDGNMDCHDRSDEVSCEHHQCREGHRKCAGGQCIPDAFWCDHWKDCPDNSDESNCDYPPCNADEFTCNSGQCIPNTYVCYHGAKDSRLGCADRSHLINCSLWVCRSDQFKCRSSYCIDAEQVCDSHLDCTMTFWDERPCPYTCPYKFEVCMCENEEMNCEGRGLTSLPAVLHHAIRDGQTKFRLGSNLFNDTLTEDTFHGLDRLSYLDLSNNSISIIPEGCFKSLWRLSTLNLQNNQLRMLRNATFIGLVNLKHVYLQGNQIESIHPDAFLGLSHLRSLDLSYQTLTVLPQNAFLGLRNLYALNLSHNDISFIADGTFNGLDNLLTLDISGNKIELIEQNVFHGIPRLETLYSDEYRFCCLAKGVSQCYPEPDEFSSCEDLMSNYVLRISIWVLGMVASFGNLLVIGWRARDIRGGKVHSFLITNLAIGDFFMGVYLMIIAVVDSYYRGVYIVHDKFWKESNLCRFAGFISTFSSELSVFTLTVITLDRLICIIFPLKFKRLGLKEASIVMASMWVLVFIISLLPLVGLNYFEHFYGRSGVCLALHVTPAKPPGWEYSVAVFLAINFVSFMAIFLSYLWMFFVAKKTRNAVRTPESKTDRAMARRMTLIVMTDFFCWVPIILLGFISLGGVHVTTEVYAWIAVFILPLNSAVNPVLYTISTAPFLGNVRKRANIFRKSFVTSFTTDVKTSYVDDRSSVWERNTSNSKSAYRHMDLIRMRSLNNRSPVHSQTDSDY
ncbi:G-protein coupled receptor GRL101-like [Gigantopelta aegis]|uniref:G-protein coupled receptor GRL101-like n=1 Tax=Gigantopelta aegis TaxID=1735272 RepID=UPI001B88E31E|nr:G-protein coupled receptor GRL101-like [Gigantopelta aegis]